MVKKSSSTTNARTSAPIVEKTAAKKRNHAPIGASTPIAAKTVGKKSNDAAGSSTPSAGASQRRSFLRYKYERGCRACSTKRAWLARPFMTDRDVVPGPAYWASGFGDQLGIGARTIEVSKAMYTDWAKTCLPDEEGDAGKRLDGGWSPTRSLAVRTARRSSYYYKAGDEVYGVREYDLQLLFPEKMPGKVETVTVVKGMQDFATCAVQVAMWKDLAKNTVIAMMRREMDIGVIQFDSETAEGILGFTQRLADDAGLR